MNDNIKINNNIMQSQIFGEEDSPKQNNKYKNKSMSPFSNMPGMSLKGSIMPLGNFEEIKEENEDDTNNEDTKETKEKNEIKEANYEFGNEYIGDDLDEEKIMKEQMKEKKKKINQSRLKTSFNIFSFTNQNDENYVSDLKNEINDLYKNRDKMEDQINDQQDKINNQEKKLKESIMQNNELKRNI